MDGKIFGYLWYLVQVEMDPHEGPCVTDAWYNNITLPIVECITFLNVNLFAFTELLGVNVKDPTFPIYIPKKYRDRARERGLLI